MKHSTFQIDQIDGYIFDLDGTIYLGDQALPGTLETIAHLRKHEKKILFVSNKPLYSRDAYAAKLTRMGIPTNESDVITSGYVLGYHLAMTNPTIALYVVGEENLKHELRDHGLFVLGEFEEQNQFEVICPEGVGAVVVSFDRTLDYRKLNTAYQALVQGSAFFATNPDMTCPMPGGGIPDAGSIIIALEQLTRRKLDLLAGKPSRLMMDVAMSRMNLPPNRCIMIGDRVETDIRMGKDAGMFAVLVLTGATKLEEGKALNPEPDWIFESMNELCKLINSQA